MISADSHVVEPAEVLAGLAERFGDEAPRIVCHDDVPDLMYVPASRQRGLPPARLGIAGFRLDAASGLAVDPAVGVKPDPEDPDDPAVVALCRGGYAALRAGIADPAERLADQDVDGVRAEVLYPSAFFTVFGYRNTELVVAAFRNYNAWLAEYCSAAPDRLLGAPLIPLHDPDAGLAELEKAVERGARTACIPCRAPAGRPYRDAAYEPIWRVAAEAGLPLALHIGTNGPGPGAGAAGGARRRPAPDPIAVYAGATSVIGDTLAELIGQGVPARHPRLTFVVSEFNAGWLPNFLDRLDQGMQRNPTAASRDLDRLPSQYWRTNFKATIEDDRSAVLVRELLGTETLLWGNDYPHRDSTWPRSRAVVDTVMAGVPDPERQLMVEGNAVALYGIV